MVGAVLRIRGDQFHHLCDVLRLAPGARLSIVDEQGACAIGWLTRLERSEAVVTVASLEMPRVRVPLILAAAIIKGPRMDVMVEKAAELGATEFWPLLCTRNQAARPGLERLARWRRLAATAARQSLGDGVMAVTEPLGFEPAVRQVPAGMTAIICEMSAPPLSRVISTVSPNGILIACGPEGDFDPGERELAHSAGLIPAGLGANRLRSETAALAALSIVGCALLERQGGS